MANGEIIYGAKDMAVGVKDPATGVFAGMVDAPGLVGYSLMLEGENEEFFGDERVMASTMTRRNAMGSFELGVHDFAVKAAVTGGTVVTVGTGAGAVKYYLAPSGPETPLVQLAGMARGVGADGGTFIARAYQTRVTSGGGVELGQQYATSSYDHTMLDFNGKYFQLEQHPGTLGAIGATAVTAIPTGA